MGTVTHTPAQSNFSTEFKLNYPEGHCPEIGSVVGPNWLGEYFVVRDFQCFYDHQRGWTTAYLELLTKDRQELLTVENRREFVAAVTANKTRELASGFVRTPELADIRKAEMAIKLGGANDALLSLLEYQARKKAAV